MKPKKVKCCKECAFEFPQEGQGQGLFCETCVSGPLCGNCVLFKHAHEHKELFDKSYPSMATVHKRLKDKYEATNSEFTKVETSAKTTDKEWSMVSEEVKELTKIVEENKEICDQVMVSDECLFYELITSFVI
ncbi:MAG: hypothetical protein GY795_05315 [Desulfobacterales bacterium]|nr:hypothetical protein [Desulfobacterales bacterium]